MPAGLEDEDFVVQLDGAVEAGVVVLADYWRPGWRAGGPVVSLGRMVDRSALPARILTRNHDLGSSDSYPGITPNHWVPGQRQNETIAYLSGLHGLRWALKELQDNPPDLVHINSLHSIPFGILPMLAMRFGRLRPRSVLISPHGELSDASQSHKPWKKRLGRPLIRALVPRNVTWHASSAREAEDITRWMGVAPTNIVIAPDPAPEPALVPSTGPDTPTVLFASRIHPIKGLDRAIETVAQLARPCRFVIAGSVEDQEYWRQCQARLKHMPDHVTVIEHGPFTPTEITRLVAEASVLLLPTKGENFGHVIAEALAEGCPVAIPPTTPWGDFVGPDAGCVSADISTTTEFISLVLAENFEQRLQRRSAVLRAYTEWFARAGSDDIYASAVHPGGRP